MCIHWQNLSENEYSYLMLLSCFDVICSNHLGLPLGYRMLGELRIINLQLYNYTSIIVRHIHKGQGPSV